MQKIEKRFTFEGRTVRWTNFVDDESLAFESEARHLLKHSPVEQTLIYQLHLSRDFYVFQMRNARGAPIVQACVNVAHPPNLPEFAMANVHHLHPIENAKDEEITLRLLRRLSSSAPGVMTLRIQPKRYASSASGQLEKRGTSYGFRGTTPLDYVRTLIVDLKAASKEEILSKFQQKTRSKIRHATREKVTLKRLNGTEWMNACREAVGASVQRTQGDVSEFNFETAFSLANTQPDKAIITGIFLNHRPEELLAYVIAYANGTRAELVSAGSVSDPELRTLPFNFFLVWEVIQWAHSLGCTELDLGGVTSGEPGDPLQGISRFKRSITKEERVIDGEMIAVVKPVRFFVYRALKKIKEVAKNVKKVQPPVVSIPAPQLEVITAHD